MRRTDQLRSEIFDIMWVWHELCTNPLMLSYSVSRRCICNSRASLGIYRGALIPSQQFFPSLLESTLQPTLRSHDFTLPLCQEYSAQYVTRKLS